jgi:prepilin-type N-terminal cleavage/methylation domain-containing protein
MRNKNLGFTLVELMMTTAILGVIFLFGPGILTNITKFSRLNSARLETQRNARTALDQINKSLRQASAATIVITQQSSQPPYSMISFSTVDGRNLSYYQQGKSLYFGSNVSTISICTGLRYIAFAYPRTDDSGILSVSLTFEKDTYQGGTKALQMAIEKVRVMNN